MTFNYFRYFLELFNYFLVMSGMIKENANICTCFETNSYRIYFEFRTFNHTYPDKPLNPLMDGSSRYSTLSGYLQVRNPGILSNNIKNFSV